MSNNLPVLLRAWIIHGGVPETQIPRFSDDLRNLLNIVSLNTTPENFEDMRNLLLNELQQDAQAVGMGSALERGRTFYAGAIRRFMSAGSPDGLGVHTEDEEKTTEPDDALQARDRERSIIMERAERAPVDGQATGGDTGADGADQSGAGGPEPPEPPVDDPEHSDDREGPTPQERPWEGNGI